MKRFIISTMIALACLSLLASTAEAKRLGGGGNVGKQRTITPQAAPTAPAAAPSLPSAPIPLAPPVTAGNRWLGPLAGLAVGAGLGALFAGGGLGGMGGILMALLAVALVMFLISMFRKKQPQAMRYSAAGAPYGNPGAVQQPVFSSAGAPATVVPACNIPAGFPVESFLRNAKISFIRLQAANDRKDLNDIREYTTPEMFAEISMQLQEREQKTDEGGQQTDVISIHADLLQVEHEGDMAIASVRFTGQLSENNGTPESVDEIWHVQKNLRDDKSVWLLAGIQQTTLR